MQQPRQYQATVSMTPDPSSLVSAPFTPSPVQRGEQSSQRLRQILQSLQPHYGPALMETFVRNVFSDKSLVDAYFFPRPLRGLTYASKVAGKPGPGALFNLIPLEVASRAATKAQAMKLIKPFERRVVYLAAFLYPCGLFHCARSQAMFNLDGGIPSFEQIETRRRVLLEDALRQLRAENPDLTNTLAAALGFAVHDGDINQEQVARIASAVYLANVKVWSLWAPIQA